MTICQRMFDVLDRLPGKNAAGLCKVLGVNTNQTTNWRQRNTDPPAKYIIPICEYLGVSVWFLLTGENREPIYITDDFEESLVSDFRELDARGKARVVALAASEHDRVRLEGDNAKTAN